MSAGVVPDGAAWPNVIPWWSEQPMVAFDFESTGRDPKTARPVSCAIARVVADNHRPEPLDRDPGTELLINPGVEIPEEAAQVHGITTEVAARDGMDPAEGIASVISLLVDLVTTEVDAERYPRPDGVTIPIVAMNAAYDFTLLHYDALRHGVTPFQEVVKRAGLTVPVIDPYVLDKRIDKFRRGFRNLPALCAAYGVAGPEAAHNALSDAVAAARLAVKIGRITPALNEMDIATLHDNQVTWRAEQCASLQTYFRRTDPGKIVDPCWPACYPENHEESPDSGHEQGALL